MVKGVKRNIIEVNNTGSECFEKIVFYLSPDFPVSGKNVADLAAAELKRIIGGAGDTKQTLRYRVKAKRNKRISVFIASAVLLVAAIVVYKLKS